MNFKFVLFIHSAIASLSGYPYSSVPNLVNGNADTFTINGCSVPKQRALFGDDFIDIMTPACNAHDVCFSCISRFEGDMSKESAMRVCNHRLADMWSAACSKIPKRKHPILYGKCKSVVGAAKAVIWAGIDIPIVKGHLITLTNQLTECDRYKNVYNNGVGFTITGNFREFRYQDLEFDEDIDLEYENDQVEYYDDEWS